MNVVPEFSVLSTLMSPPGNGQNFLLIVRPGPVPLAVVFGAANLGEFLKQFTDITRGYPGTIIRNVKTDPVSFVVDYLPDGQADLTVVCKLAGIAEIAGIFSGVEVM